MLEAIKIYFIPCLINVITGIYVLSNLIKIKLDYKDYKIYLSILILVCISILNFVYVNNLYRAVLITLAVSFVNYILFKQNLRITIISSLIEQSIAMISEMFVTIVIFIFSDYTSNEVINNFYGNIFTNIFISLLMIVISKSIIVEKLYHILINSTNKLKMNLLVIFSFILIITANIIFFMSLYDGENFSRINLIFIYIYSFIFYLALNQKNENIKFKEENELLLKNLNEYEKMLDYQRVNNHENKNQLLIIKEMINQKNNKIKEYIDEIIKEKREDNEALYTKAKRIPSGGLQGIIYQKMLLMKEENIDIKLNISKDVKNIDLSIISQKTNYDICRIMGILLDNAIDETKKFDKDNREILVSMYVDDDFIIEISNKIKDSVDLEKIYNKGYTTKEKGHGYGLILLRKIINSNNKIENKVKVINDAFIQTIKIKI